MNDKSPLDKAKDTLSNAADQASDIASDATDKVKNKAHDAKETAEDARETARSKASEAADDAQQKASKGVDKVSGKVDDLRRRDAGDEVEKSAKDAQSFLVKNVRKHPVLALLFAGFLGILIGRNSNRR